MNLHKFAQPCYQPSLIILFTLTGNGRETKKPYLGDMPHPIKTSGAHSGAFKELDSQRKDHRKSLIRYQNT